MADPQRKPFAPGVTVKLEWWFDEYRGTPEALAAVGLVDLDRIPGAPGMNKFTMGITAGGDLIKKWRHGVREPGAKRISRLGKLLDVEVAIDRNIGEARREAWFAARAEAEAAQRKAGQREGHRHAAIHLRGIRVLPLARQLPAGWSVIQGGRHG